MHCLKSLRTANPGILLLFKNAVISARVGADTSRSQQPALLSNWAASPHTHKAIHQKGPDVDKGHSKNQLMSSMEDLLFYTITDGKEMIPLSVFFSALKKTGLLTSDPRLRDCVHQMRQSTRDSVGPVMMDKKLFRRYSVGDTKIPFCLQSCVKPLEYAIAVHELGSDHVHQFVGKEPSGFKFNKLSLNEEDKPHNPMVNAGAIVISSLIKPHSNKAARFDHVMDFLNSMAGTEYVGFSNATFQSERETGDRNYAIGYYLKEKKCFPDNADMTAALDFYFQLCSIEITCESGSVMAATLANGGICPITGDRVLSAEAVRNTLSLMHSCGMYDFSGQFAFHVGLPAKSGVSGAVLLVVPNVMGMLCWSPPLDRLGNSVRGIHFCQDLVSHFNFHNYDNLRHFTKKHDPRRGSDDDPNKSVVNLMFAAYSGDVTALRRFALSAVDMEQRDYDSRTALHVAAAEGHEDAVTFLTEICKVNPYIKDRWGNTPLDDAMQFGHDVVVSVLHKYQSEYTDSVSPSNTAEQKTTLDTMKSTL
ncbi:glutaminase kidney isoform, mitochondrial isoform 5-T5 [Odontesthes bonariensis]|uniref:glutaminase kidney isoform, mitochondrial isoform X5 n=1 Tax=Odontesthes bonariensis TaxID=219752 RepID=UPI003F58DA55